MPWRSLLRRVAATTTRTGCMALLCCSHLPSASAIVLRALDIGPPLSTSLRGTLRWCLDASAQRSCALNPIRRPPILTPPSHTHIQVLLAISNSIASIPGVGAGVLTGQLLGATKDDWRLMFSIAAAVQAAGALIFLCFADVCEQNFDGLALRGSIQQRSVDQASCVPSHTEPLITDA